jgi:hypothetical protein
MPGRQESGRPDMPPLAADRPAQHVSSITSHSKGRLI